MAVGINAIRAICCRVPSILVTDETQGGDPLLQDSAVNMDIPAFVQDIASYAKHTDKSVRTAGRAFLNFIREVYPTLLGSKDRGELGSALHKIKQMPLKYGETKINYGVEGADLLVEYEAKKAVRQQLLEEEDNEHAGDLPIIMEDEEDEEDEGMSEEEDNSQTDENISEQHEDYNDEEDENDSNDDDEEAPSLTNLDQIDLTKLSSKQRNTLSQQVSSTRIFSTSELVKIRKLLSRQEKLKRDPRAAARIKRLKAQGRDDETMGYSDEDDNSVSDEEESDDDDEIHIQGAVDPGTLRSTLTRKKANKAERLAKVIAGREEFAQKGRQGGSTNTEKSRKKLFTMTKFSDGARKKRNTKWSNAGLKQKRRESGFGGLDDRKRRRKT